jgi:phosphatidate phosphatase APP1
MKLGIAARIEDKTLDGAQAFVHRFFDWLPRVEPYVSIGTPTTIRVLARALMSPAEQRRHVPSPSMRGFRSYISLPADEEQVEIRIKDLTEMVMTDRGGYIDHNFHLVDPLAPGWHSIHFTATRSGATAKASLLVVDPKATIGMISDVDDTAMITAVPRLAHAAWNTFLKKVGDREPVAGMAAFMTAIQDEHHNAPVIYLSNGAWNTIRNLGRFLKKFEFPAGAMLLTDFGPTDTGWFRSGMAHKRQQLQWIMETFPNIGWVLIGDDGQADPKIYAEVARKFPDRVAAIAIRTLSQMERVIWLADTDPAQLGNHQVADVPYICAPNGIELLDQFREIGLVADTLGAAAPAKLTRN